jgi:hypothetical protein
MWLLDMDGDYVSIAKATAHNLRRMYPSANPELEMWVLLTPLWVN